VWKQAGFQRVVGGKSRRRKGKTDSYIWRDQRRGVALSKKTVRAGVGARCRVFTRVDSKGLNAEHDLSEDCKLEIGH